MGRGFSNFIPRVLIEEVSAHASNFIPASPSGLFLHKDIITEYMKDKRLRIETYSAPAISVGELESLVYIGGGDEVVQKKHIFAFLKKDRS